MKKLFISIILVCISNIALSKDISLICEVRGESFNDAMEKDANIVGNSIYHFDENKNSFSSDNGIELCQINKADGLFNESTLINKKNIYYQCKISDIRNSPTIEHSETLKINRISGEISHTSTWVYRDGKKSYMNTTGLCKKASAKF
jgi:hypothetical protein